MRNIASRAAVGFALVWAITATTVIFSAVLARDASDVLERTLVAYADDLMHASQAQVAAERMVAIGRGYLLTKDPARLARAKDTEEELDRALQALDRGDVRPAELALLQEVQRSAADYRHLLDSTFEYAPTSVVQRGPDETLRERLLPAREDLGVRLANLVALKQQLQVAARRRADAMAARSVRVTIGLGAFALLLSAGLANMFTKRLVETSRHEKESAQRATRALAARDELLGIVAHDLRSPLAAIALRASVMIRGGLDPETTHSAKAIQSVCSRMAYLIESLLDAAGVEQGGLRMRPSRFRVEPLIQTAIETFAPAASEKSIRLQGAAVPTDLAVWADRDRLFQVLSNLVGNALKFTPERGVVRISASDERGGVRFEITDTGSGIAAENLSRVFERYWKSDSDSLRGAGLGLYIARGIVEAHGGRIWVESTPGIGSSFRFDLPESVARHDSREPAPLATPPTPPTPDASTDRERHAHH